MLIFCFFIFVVVLKVSSVYGVHICCWQTLVVTCTKRYFHQLVSPSNPNSSFWRISNITSWKMRRGYRKLQKLNHRVTKLRRYILLSSVFILWMRDDNSAINIKRGSRGAAHLFAIHLAGFSAKSRSSKEIDSQSTDPAQSQLKPMTSLYKDKIRQRYGAA